MTIPRPDERSPPHRRGAIRGGARARCSIAPTSSSEAGRRGRIECSDRLHRRPVPRDALDQDAGVLPGRGRRARRPPAAAPRRRDAARPRRVDRRHRPGAVALRARVVIRSGSARTSSRSSPTPRQVPVVNRLTPVHHPCQAIADLQTLRERFGGARRAQGGLRRRRQQRRALARAARAHARRRGPGRGARRLAAGARLAARIRTMRARRSPVPTPSTPTSG